MLRVGTSGYSYTDWKGEFYPANLKQAGMLPFYAQEFNAVEINYTYYRMPSARTLTAMAAKVPPGFQFTLKLNRQITHDRPSDHGPDPALCQEFCQTLKPLQDQGKLGCVLAQFPTAFHNTEENCAYLENLRDLLGQIPTVVEFRHRSWVDQSVFDWLRQLQLGFCCVDQPSFEVLIPPIAVATAPVAYVRFHGRNAAKWWQHEQAYQRYDYSYSDMELREWVPKLQQLQQQAQQVYIFANNCYKSQSVTTARQLKALMGIATPTTSVTQLELL